jgi:hypothetical protein
METLAESFNYSSFSWVNQAPISGRGSCLKSKRPWLRVWKCSRGSRIVASLDSKIMSSELDGTEVNEEQTIYYVCIYDIYVYGILLYYIYSSGETRCMLLDSFTKHPSRSSADHISKSVLCGRCGTVDYHPLLNLYDFKAFGEWKCDRGTTKLHARILRGKGVQKKKKPHMLTVGSSTSASLSLSSQCMCIYICIYNIYIY